MKYYLWQNITLINLRAEQRVSSNLIGLVTPYSIKYFRLRTICLKAPRDRIFPADTGKYSWISISRTARVAKNN